MMLSIGKLIIDFSLFIGDYRNTSRKSVRKRTLTVLKPYTFISDTNFQIHVNQTIIFLAYDLLLNN